MYETLAKVRKALALLAGRLDPAVFTAAQAARLIEMLVGIERLVAGMRIRLSARVDNDSLFGADGDRSASEWLGKATGQSPSEAQRDIDCAKQLEDLPDTDRAVQDGELSPTQVREVADAASKDRQAERRLLDTAKRRSVPELKREAKKVKAAAIGDDDARQERARRRRSLVTGVDELGEWWGRITGTADKGAEFEAALKPWVEREFERTRKEGRRETREALRYDGFMAMVAAQAGGTTKAGERVRPLGRPKLIARVDLPALVRGRTEPGEVAEISGVGPVPVTALRELLPGSAIHLVITNGADANVTNLSRKPNVAQATVMQWLGIECRREGCYCTENLQVDHDEEWHRLRVTELDKLDWLCPHDHHLKTHEGWKLEPGRGKRRFLSPEEQADRPEANAPPAA